MTALTDFFVLAPRFHVLRASDRLVHLSAAHDHSTLHFSIRGRAIISPTKHQLDHLVAQRHTSAPRRDRAGSSLFGCSSKWPLPSFLPRDAAILDVTHQRLMKLQPRKC